MLKSVQGVHKLKFHLKLLYQAYVSDTPYNPRLNQNLIVLWTNTDHVQEFSGSLRKRELQWNHLL